MMDPGIVAALIGVVGAAVLAAVGGTVKFMRSKADKVVEKLEHDVELLEKAVNVKDEAIADLRSQRDRLQITADLMDRFLNQLPPPRRTGD